MYMYAIFMLIQKIDILLSTIKVVTQYSFTVISYL